MRVSFREGAAIAEIDSLPGSPQVAVVHKAVVHPSLRGHGVGSDAHKDRLHMMKHELMYDAAICTVDKRNLVQVSILHANGWNWAAEFKSRATGHIVCIYTKVLNTEGA